MVTIQVSFLLRRLRTLLANDSRKRARVPAGSVPGYPQGVPLLYDGRACRAVVE